jgi:hypothetical protein
VQKGETCRPIHQSNVKHVLIRLIYSKCKFTILEREREIGGGGSHQTDTLVRQFRV